MPHLHPRQQLAHCMFVFLWNKSIQLQDEKHIQAFLLHFLIYKARVLENFTLQQQVWIWHKNVRRSLGILLKIFSPSMFLTTVTEESLLKKLPEWGVSKCNYVRTLDVLVLWNTRMQKQCLFNKFPALPKERFFSVFNLREKLQQRSRLLDLEFLSRFCICITSVTSFFRDSTRVLLPLYYVPPFLWICTIVSLLLFCSFILIITFS